MFEHICATLERSYNEKDMEIINISLFYFLSSIIYYKESYPNIYDNDEVSKSILFMKQNLEKKLTVAELAHKQKLSGSHYNRIFKQKMGISPINYFNQLKIQKSCQFLYFIYKSIKEICTEVGFEDPYYFSRLFRKEMGISPSKYKRLNKR